MANEGVFRLSGTRCSTIPPPAENENKRVGGTYAARISLRARDSSLSFLARISFDFSTRERNVLTVDNVINVSNPLWSMNTRGVNDEELSPVSRRPHY